MSKRNISDVLPCPIIKSLLRPSKIRSFTISSSTSVMQEHCLDQVDLVCFFDVFIPDNLVTAETTPDSHLKFYLSNSSLYMMFSHSNDLGGNLIIRNAC